MSAKPKGLSVPKKSDDVKVRVPIPPGAWHGATAERLWAEPAGRNLYRIKNIPGYAHDLAVDDVVEVARTGPDLNVIAVRERSGRSTFQAVFDEMPEPERFEEFWAPFEKLGCRCERSEQPYAVVAIDVPPSVDSEEVFRLLEEAEPKFGFQFMDAYMHSNSDGDA